MELFDYGELGIPMSAAINSMLKSLELALDLQFQKWLRSAAYDPTIGGARNNEACMKL